jgi:hypothetical protein
LPHDPCAPCRSTLMPHPRNPGPLAARPVFRFAPISLHEPRAEPSSCCGGVSPVRVRSRWCRPCISRRRRRSAPCRTGTS